MAEAVQMLHQIHHACKLYELAGHDCGDNELLKNADIGWPATLSTEDCFDEAYMCFETKDWHYVDYGGGEFLAVPRKYLENPPYVLDINTHNDVEKVFCMNWGDASACQKICGSNNCYLD